MKIPLVSIVIPTVNSGLFLENTFKSIKSQTYKNVETIVVDGQSRDNTLILAKRYKAIVFQLKTNLPKGTFDAPYRRNYGVKKSKGEYVYYVDADMELSPTLIEEAVRLCQGKYDALILPEDSFGEGAWANAKNLERRCYWGDNLIESPRFFKKSVWEAVGGLDESLAGGRDDGDLYEKLKEKNYKIGRTKSLVMHNEGKLTASRLFWKKYMYGKDIKKYLAKRPVTGVASYSPIRLSFIKNGKLFISRPKDTVVFLAMKAIEITGGITGLIVSMVKK